MKNDRHSYWVAQLLTADYVILNRVYKVQEDGRILRINKGGNGYLKCYPDKSGYLKVAIVIKKKTFNSFVHRLVYQAFIGQIPDGMTVDHIDGNRLNNHRDNLQLLSAGDNAAKGNARNWIVTSPDGKEIEVYNLGKFCRENNLHKSHITTHSYKGWKARCVI